ncbi:uncharacterized protein LOC106644667 [Copidosoma floridanum]|uniref:uncharacterized protein LOC106644667 n=1 Tax=Copidosoma floridanum TaxID=29053 RepID=UPI0006C984EA|nr:uncharacterized protein LOC106644667 [Copidosoma floridanum]
MKIRVVFDMSLNTSPLVIFISCAVLPLHITCQTDAPNDFRFNRGYASSYQYQYQWYHAVTDNPRKRYQERPLARKTTNFSPLPKNPIVPNPAFESTSTNNLTAAILEISIIDDTASSCCAIAGCPLRGTQNYWIEKITCHCAKDGFCDWSGVAASILAAMRCKPDEAFIHGACRQKD